MQYAQVIFDNRQDIRRKVEDALSAGIANASAVTEAQAGSLVPVRSGFLRSTIHARPDGKLRFIIEALAAYAGYVELGTSGRSAQPYMVPALLFTSSVLVSLLRREFAARFSS